MELLCISLICLACDVRTPSAGQLVEPVKLHTAIRHISSPFLNRRLGGLKILSDLVRRAVNATEFPTGWRITRTVESNGDVSASYSVVPILYAFTPSMIAAQLAELSVMATLFEGEIYITISNIFVFFVTLI